MFAEANFLPSPLVDSRTLSPGTFKSSCNCRGIWRPQIENQRTLSRNQWETFVFNKLLMKGQNVLSKALHCENVVFHPCHIIISIMLVALHWKSLPYSKRRLFSCLSNIFVNFCTDFARICSVTLLYWFFCRCDNNNHTFYRHQKTAKTFNVSYSII